jgi:excisionase family DNA binding protein
MTTIEVEFFSPKTLAVRWSRSRNHIYDLIDRGDLKASRWGKMVQIHRAEVERYEKAMLSCEHQKQTATTSASAEGVSSMSSGSTVDEKNVTCLQRELQKMTPAATSKS